MWSKMAFHIYMLIVWELNLSKTFFKRRKKKSKTNGGNLWSVEIRFRFVELGN
jgi:hypothetical protein